MKQKSFFEACTIMHTAWFLFCAVLFISLSFMIYRAAPSTNAHLEIDSIEYTSIAENFLETGSFVGKSRNMPVHTLGYPYFLGLIFKACGSSIAVIVFFQILLSLLCGSMIVLISYYLFSMRVALISAFFFAINLGFLIYSQLVLAEILFVTLMLIFFERFIRFMQRGEVLSLILASLFLGVASIVRPVPLLYVFFLYLLLFVFLLNSGVRKALFKMVLFSFVFYVPVIGYMTSNYWNYGNFTFSSLMQVGLCSTFPQIVAESHSISLSEMHSSVGIEKESVKSYVYFIELIKRYPYAFITTWIWNIVKTYLGLYLTQFKVLLNPSIRGGRCSFFKMKETGFRQVYNYLTYGTHSQKILLVGFWEVFYSLARYVLFLIALYRLFLKGKWVLLLLFCSYIAYIGLITGFDGCGRYRLMFEFLLIILSSQGLILVYEKIRFYFRKREFINVSGTTL